MKKSEEKIRKEKYKLWKISDYFFATDKREKSKKSIGKKVFAIGAAAALIALFAFATAVAQGDDWPYDEDPMAWDSHEDPLLQELTSSDFYTQTDSGVSVGINVAASGNYPNEVAVDIYKGSNLIDSIHVGDASGGIHYVEVDIPSGTEYLGVYNIVPRNADGLPEVGPVTDSFTVVNEAGEIPEFPTVAVPLIASVLLVWGFMRKKKGL